MSMTLLADGRRHRVPAVRGAVVVEGLTSDERLGDAVVDDDAAQRRHTGSRALGEDDEVRLDVVADRTEPLPDATEPGDDLVGGQQDAVLVGQRAKPGPVPGRRSEATTGVLHRLGDDQRHLVGAGIDDRLLHLLKQSLGERSLSRHPWGDGRHWSH